MMRLLPFLFGVLVNADMYLQYPMGSNNRLDDENRDRNNANRLMDTQNNNRGGFNVGNVFFYAGTQVPIKWTAQHSCGNPNNHCEIILQMMCDAKLRDGTTQNTIPDNPVECYNWDCDTDVRYGRHESFDFYQTCKKTERNKGLFLADQNVKGNSAQYTRQNPNGARRGYECPEERDYYPYWRPSPWVDIAYFTNAKENCVKAVEMSQNIMPRSYCKLKTQYLYMKNVINGNNPLPINKSKCEELSIVVPKMIALVDETTGEEVIDAETGKPVMVKDGAKTLTIFPGKWVEDGKGETPLYPKSFKLGATLGKPICMGNTWSRDNHHGNVVGGDFAGFQWTVPDIQEENCVLRIRYNISTGDLPHLDTDLTTLPYNYEEVGKGAMYYVGQQLGWTNEEIKENGYYYKNNPQIAPFYGYTAGANGQTEFKAAADGTHLKFQLAINTAQYGRTFQDRSHRFSIKKRPGNVPSTANLYNLGVRGKRGNIVQTYPGTEYSFQPEELTVSVGDYVHVQWVGSNTNPNNNAGQGRQGSDRHNMLTMKNRNYAEAGQTDAWLGEGKMNIYGQLGNSYPAYIGKDPNSEDETQESLSEFLGFSKAARRKLAILKGVNTNGGELSELDDSGTWANFAPMKVTKVGFYNYLCTRNNNFSNRSQKGKIKVVATGAQTMTAMIGYNGATVTSGGASLIVGEGSLQQGVQEFQPLGMSEDGFCGGRCASQYFNIPNLVTDTSTTVKIPYTYAADQEPVVYYTTSNSINADSWEKVESQDCSGSVGSDGVCTFTPTSKGTYVVSGNVSWWVYLLSIIAVILCLGVSFFMFKRFKGSAAN